MNDVLTLKWMKDRNACQEGIDFAIRNKLIGFPFDRIGEIKGDFNWFVGWVKDKLNSDIQYEYDVNGNRIKKVFPSGRIITYEYDSHGNKIKEVYPSGNVYIYEYDAHDNMIKKVLPNNRTYTYQYDSHGNMIKMV